MLDSRPRTISDEPNQLAEAYMWPRANLQTGSGRSLRGPPLDYQRYNTKIGVSPRLPEHVPRALEYSVLPLPCVNRRLSMVDFCGNCFSSTTVTVGLYGSQHRRLWLVLFHALKRLGVICSASAGPRTGPRPTSSPPFNANKEPLRRFHQQDVQPSLARLATKPRVLCTHALRCARAGPR